jgi:hypothetical protein
MRLVRLCLWLIFSFLSTFMDIVTNNREQRFVAHSTESHFVLRVIITMPGSCTQYIKTICVWEF